MTYIGIYFPSIKSHIMPQKNIALFALFLSYIFLQCPYKSFAQHNNEFCNKGALVHIQNGAEVHVWGDVHNYSTSGVLENNGLLKVQGNLYSDDLFQQSGTGTTRIENSDVNTAERQFISGSYAVRGDQTQIGINDGSFYNLELNNSQGVVYLVRTNSSLVADVRGSVNFGHPGLANNIVTHNIGPSGPITYPANGSLYESIFGMMNAAGGLNNYINDTWHQTGNNYMSSLDQGYIIGKHRRAIAPTGGTYGYLIGLDPGPNAANNGLNKGLQCIQFTFNANNYNVLTGYYQAGSPNMAPVAVECSGYQIDRWWGIDHGEWNFKDIHNVIGGGTYEVKVWPQDPTTPFVGSVYTISKDDVFSYPTAPLHNDCGPTAVGLERNGFEDFSQFGIVSGDIILGQHCFQANDTSSIGDSISAIDHNKGVYRRYFQPIPDSVPGDMKVSWKSRSDTATRRKTLTKNERLSGNVKLNITPWFNDTIRIDIYSDIEGIICRSMDYYIPCKTMILQMVEQTPAFCAGDSALVRAGYSGGQGAKTIQWSNGATTKRTYAQQGEKLIVTLTDATGCSLTDSITASTINTSASPGNLFVARNAAILTASWAPPSLTTGQSVLFYRVNYRLRGTTTWMTTPSVTDTFSIMNWNGSGIAAGNYEFMVVARIDDNGIKYTSQPSCKYVRGYNGVGGKTEAVDTAEATDVPNISIYPNPTDNILYVQAPESSSLMLVDMNGRILAQLTTERLETAIDISSYAQGMYTLQIITEDAINISSVVKE